MYYKTFRGQQIAALGMGVLRLPMDALHPECIDWIAGQKIIDLAIRFLGGA